jgi:hypothetical protein
MVPRHYGVSIESEETTTTPSGTNGEAHSVDRRKEMRQAKGLAHLRNLNSLWEKEVMILTHFYRTERLVVILLLFTSCGTTQPTSPPIESVMNAANSLVSTERNVMERQVQKCMKLNGFAFTPRSIASSQQVVSAVFPIASTVDFERLRTHGYGIAETSMTRADPNKSIFDAMDRQTQTDYSRTQRACYLDAQQIIRTSTISKHLRAVVSATDRFKKSPKVRDADLRWGRCMSAAGYQKMTVRNFELMDIVRAMAGHDDEDTENLRRIELAVARDDARCLKPDLALRISEWKKAQK